MEINIQQIRSEFPILRTRVHGKPLIYLDNGATTQKPQKVIDRLVQYYSSENSNVHRGAHQLSNKATEAFEGARKYIAGFIDAASADEIIFTKGTTDGINMVATGLTGYINPGDAILISAMEHHSNLVPWQELCSKTGAELLVLPVLYDGTLDLSPLSENLLIRTKLIALTHVSNVLGTINPIKQITELAHRYHIPVLVDGAQAIAHLAVDVQDLDCDFYVFSAHKAYGPMGAGVLYGKKHWLDKLQPSEFGGEMIDQVSLETTTFNVLPYRLEAGTPNVADVLGMEAGLQYLETLGQNTVRAYEDQLLDWITQRLKNIDGLHLIGESSDKTAVVSFAIDGIHHYDLGTLLDQMGIAVRTGNHCAQPLMKELNITGTIRISLALYNTLEELEYFEKSLLKAISMLK